MRTKRKMTAVIICILFAVIFACYGFWMSGNGSGTGFFLIWFVLAALLGGCAAITFLDGWARIPMWMLWILRGILLVFVFSFVMIRTSLSLGRHSAANKPATPLPTMTTSVLMYSLFFISFIKSLALFSYIVNNDIFAQSKTSIIFNYTYSNI